MPEPARQIILCFDFGTGQIGVAVGQTVAATTRGLGVLKALDGKPDWQELAELVAEWDPDRLLVGLPLNMDGSESEFCRRCRKFARRLIARTGLKVQMVDERLSTAEAKSARFLRQPNKQGSYRDKPVDAEAAALILQTWLDSPDCALEP